MIPIDEFKNKITKKSRLLGLDLGSKRIGVAICDDRQSIATPFRTINKESSDQFINELKLIIKENNIVFVDITADWCATCQFNKKYVINSSIIQKIFEKNNIIKVRGDWTKPNKKIENFLQKHNRFGIPFNIMYNKFYPNGIILSELLTKKEIIDTLKKMKKN